MITAKHYDLRVNGQIVWDLAETEIAALFRTGRVSTSTPCRLYGRTEWQNVNEYLPLLKYGTREREEPASERETSHLADESRAPGGAKWKVAVSCFAAGLLCAGAVNAVPRELILSQSSQPRISRVVYAEPLHPASASSETSVQTQALLQQWRAEKVSAQRNGPASSSSSFSAQRNTSSRSAIGPSAAATLPSRPQEATISLGKWTTVSSPYGFFRIKVRDEGPRAISVWVDEANEPKRYEKVRGFESTGSNVVQIHSMPGAKIYYVDRLQVPIGSCVLKVVPEA